MKWLLFLSLLICSSCANSFLSVHTDYLSCENLASYHVGTPDPRLNNPPIGQRLIVIWAVPRPCLYYNDLYLDVTIRFRNREEIRERVEVDRMHGTYVYELLNDDYIEKGGMLTYKIDLIGDGYILEEWRHQIWTETIDIPFQQPQNATCDDEVIEDEFSE